MTSGTIGRSFEMLGRFRLSKLAKLRSPTAVFCKRGQNRIGFVFVLLSLICCSAAHRVELANEINYSINRLQTSQPNISSADMQNVLIAAYCHVVAHAPGLNASERWSRMRQFTSVLEQQIAANRLAPGTLLIANVPLPPDVFRELRSQAASSHQTTTQLMAAILIRAAGK